MRGSPPAAPPPAELQPAPDAQTQNPPPAEPYIQTGAITNVRSGPSTTFEIVGRLNANSTVAVVGRTEAGDWWQIEFEPAPQARGWVSGEVVEFFGDAPTVPVVNAPEPPPAAATATPENENADQPAADTPAPEAQADSAAPVVQIPAGGVNVRSGPGLNFELLGRLDEGTSVPVVAKNNTGDWWQIEYPAGENGLAWVADVVVNFNGDRNAVPLAATANQAGTSASTPPPAEPPIAGSIEAIDPINVRSEPSLDGVILGGLYPGDTADVLAVSEDGDWWQIEFADAPGQPAWVSAEFVRFQGEKNSVPVFGIGTPTPTPGPTNTPTPTPTTTPTPTIPAEQPTFAPTATSVYQATSAALLTTRGTPDPSLEQGGTAGQSAASYWSNIPWGVLSILVIIGFFWYQFSLRRRRR